MTRTPRVNDLRTLSDNLRKRLPVSISRKTLVYAGAGLALAGAGAGAATAGFTGTTASADSASHAVVAAVAGQHHAAAASHGKDAPIPVKHTATRHAAAKPAAVKHTAAKHTAVNPAAVKHTAAKHTAAKPAAVKHTAAKHPAAKHTAAKPAAVKHTAAKHPAAKHPAAKPAAKHVAKHAQTWAAVSKIVAERAYPKPGPGALPAQDQLTPAGISGPQTWLPITPARYDDARAIVGQAIAKHMGLRSAVIAVATSMQETGLLNLGYGTSDSLGLFQQRPSMGWGTAQQIMTPKYAADAFLSALRTYQASDPGWASQPLWQTAQGVQRSAFPTAYAKWEAQAAQLVASVTPHLV